MDAAKVSVTNCRTERFKLKIGNPVENAWVSDVRDRLGKEMIRVPSDDSARRSWTPSDEHVVVARR